MPNPVIDNLNSISPNAIIGSKEILKLAEDSLPFSIFPYDF